MDRSKGPAVGRGNCAPPLHRAWASGDGRGLSEPELPRLAEAVRREPIDAVWVSGSDRPRMGGSDGSVALPVRHAAGQADAGCRAPDSRNRIISRRFFLNAGGLLALLGVPSPVAAHQIDTPAATIESFYETLLAVMKDGQKLGFAGRREQLAPAIRQAYDFPLMTRLMVGPQWQNLSPADRRQLIDAFSDFSVATYASRFDDFSGERFEVDPNPTPAPNNDVIIHTKLVRPNDAPVQLDYLLRDSGSAWQIVDVYLSGTVSELATRRSEFSSVLRRGGTNALVDLLKKKAAQLSG